MTPAHPLDPSTPVAPAPTTPIHAAVTRWAARRDAVALVRTGLAAWVPVAPACWCPGWRAGERCRTKSGRAVPDHVGRRR